MGNDLKYGLVLGAVLILIFIGYLAMRTPPEESGIGVTTQEEPITTEPDMFEPPQVADVPRRPASAQVEMTAPDEGEEETAVGQAARDEVSPPTIAGMEDMPLPAPVEHTEVEEEPLRTDEVTFYTIQEGDVLTKISQKFYGTTTKWREIHQANLDVIPDADRLKPGTEIVIPDIAAQAARARAEPAEAPASTSGQARTHTVGKGETLYSIAEDYYGDGNRWREIYEANKSKIPNANVLKVGLELTIP